MLTTTPGLEAGYARKRVDAVQAVVEEPVLDAIAFHRRGLYTQKFLGRLGFLPWLLARAFAKKQAGGLPQSFMVAITATKLQAFKYKARGRMRDRYEIGEEVAAWDRASTGVTWKPGPPYAVDVTIQPAVGAKILCRCGRGESSEHALLMMANGHAPA